MPESAIDQSAFRDGIQHSCRMFPTPLGRFKFGVARVRGRRDRSISIDTVHSRFATAIADQSERAIGLRSSDRPEQATFFVTRTFLLGKKLINLFTSEPAFMSLALPHSNDRNDRSGARRGARRKLVSLSSFLSFRMSKHEARSA
jgi:hypothetical protein